MPLRGRWQVAARPGQSGPRSRQSRRSAKHGNRLKHQATSASLRAQVIALEDGCEAAEDMARGAQAGKVKAEALLAEKAAECDRALSILNRTHG